MERIKNELSVLRQITHPNLLRLVDVVHTVDKFYIISNRGGDDLFEYLSRQHAPVSDEKAKIIMQKYKKMNFFDALKTAMGMSFISMIAMELSMNLTDLIFAGGIITWWVIPMMLTAGFLTPWPYNYWRLKKYGIACH